MTRRRPFPGPRSALVLLLVLGAGCDVVDAGSDVPADAPAASRFTRLYQDYLYRCASCHSPGAPGRTSGIEQSLDFGTADTAWSTLTGGVASGLVGNQESCNGVPFVGSSLGTSLLAAVLLEDVRAAYSVDGASGTCDADAVSDMPQKGGFAPPDASVRANLAAWIAEGAPR